MGKLILQILAGVAAIIPYLQEWQQQRKLKKVQQQIEEFHSRVAANPGAEFLREFNPGADTNTAKSASETNSEQPDRDN